VSNIFLKFFIMAKNSIKQVKIQGKYRASQSKYLGASGKEVPWLSLSGVWLEQSGFNIGDCVRVVSRSGLLVIERVELGNQDQQDYKATLQEVKQTLKKLAQ